MIPRERPGRRGEKRARGGRRRRGSHASASTHWKNGGKAGANTQQGLGGRAGRALGWSFTNNAVAKLGTVAIGVMLARLLGPHAFGTYAVAYIALVALLNLNDLGVSLAIVRWPGEPSEIAPTVTTISVAASLVTYAGCFVGAPAYCAAMGAPAATGVIRVLSLVVVVDGAIASPAGLLQRHFRQDLKMIADQANVWVGAGVTAGLAWSGFGAMSLAIGRLTGCLAALVLFVVFSPEPVRFGFDKEKARALLKFGLPLAGSGVIVFAVVNADQLITGRLLGVTALGFFVLAANLSGWPVTIFSQPVRSVAPAALARLQHDRAAMHQGFLSALGLLGGAALPMCLAISVSSSPLVGFVYGARWLPAARPLVWLAVLAGLQIIFQLSYDYFVVLAKSRAVFTLQLLWLVALVPALVAGGLVGGISGVALAEAAVAAGLILPCYLWELGRTGIGSRAVIRKLWLPVTAAAVVGLAGLIVVRVVTSDLLALAVIGATAAGVIGLLAYRAKAEIAQLRQPAELPVNGHTVVTATATVSIGPETGAPIPRADVDHRVLHDACRPSAVPHQQAGLTLSEPWPRHLRRADSTGPLPLDRDIPAVPGQTEVLQPSLPLYRQTVAQLRWDPGAISGEVESPPADTHPRYHQL